MADGQPEAKGMRKGVVIAVMIVLGIIVAKPLLLALLFAGIGYFVYSCVHYAMKGKPLPAGQLRQILDQGKVTAGTVGRWVYAETDRLLQVLSQRWWPGVVAAGHSWIGRLRQRLRFLGVVTVEMGCGALVGAILGMLGGTRAGYEDFAVPVGAGAGALLGFFVGLSRRQRAPELVEIGTGEESP